MLKQRVITASVLMLGFLSLLFLSPWFVFVAVIAGVFAIGAWEWANLSGLISTWARLAYTLFIAALAVAFFYFSSFAAETALTAKATIVACTWWAVALLWVQSYPASSVLWRPKWVRLFMGGLVLLPALFSVAWLRQQANGIELILFALLLVAAADSGAYFSGRAFGKGKLAPAVSPGKTWAGVWGGLLLSLLVGLAYGYFVLALSLPFLLVLIPPVALVSVLGDLLESMLKRERGIKDSGSILPGHGGVLDRLDGVVAAIPLLVLVLAHAS
ncbi:phosphatidate cytidylyltransferase [Agaribacterium sp. ZY112]|uniref:phosphatidate cytidylyltransferase n=1 Tax=Agaribacterium sp. ZY112 TaxID=3233574 RepID=UPI003525CEE6